MIRDLKQFNTFYKKAIAILGCMFFVLVIFYGILVNALFSKGNERVAVEREIVAAKTRIAILEGEYLQAVDSLTLARAHDMGFVDCDIDLFVSRRTESFSLNTQND
jgi:hypothetical protein